MDNDLIYDVGAHLGEDTEFYLKKGFRVIAVEANPDFCKRIKQRFQKEISDGQLIVLNIAIAQDAGEVEFFANKDCSVWGTTKPAWVERNRIAGSSRVLKLKVKSESLCSIFKTYGLPH